MTDRLAPVGGGERIDALDLIRGFALFGVLLVNLDWHTVMAVPQMRIDALPFAGVDRAFGFVIEWLADGKAQALFSMLFGFGFAVFMERARQRGLNATVLYLRRAGVLLVIGIAHLCLLWIDDILHAYALLAFALPLARRLPNGLLLAAGILLSVFSYPILDLYLQSQTGSGIEPALYAAWEEGRSIRYDVFLDGTYGAYVGELARAHDAELFGTAFYPAYLATIFGRFLIGYWIFRQGWLQDVARYAATLRRAVPWTLGGGLALGVVAPLVNAFDFDFATSGEFAADAATGTSQLLLAFSYAAGLALLWLTPVWRRTLHGLTAVGRMALTNYLAQSLLYLFVLYGFGLGWLRFAGSTACVAIALVAFAVQVAVSRWWLARFRFGPMEWLWRSATYGRWQQLRVRPV